MPKQSRQEECYALFNKHQSMSSNELSQTFSIPYSTICKWRKQWREDKAELAVRLKQLEHYEQAPPPEEIKSNRWLTFAGFLAGVALMLLFVMYDRTV